VQTRSGAEIVVDGDVVYKLHRPGTDQRALTTRLRIAAESGSFLSPLEVVPQRVGTTWRTRWPRVETVVPEPEYVPWDEAGQLLARLHAESVPPRTPVHGWPKRLRRAVDALRSRPNAIVRRAADRLPDGVWRAGSPDRPSTLVHGDWHLGQLGQRQPDAPWLLIDVDDLGVGDPAWDLARPAAFWATGLIPDHHWTVFLEAYQNNDGPALTAEPWSVLEPFARAAAVQAAATGIARGDSDETQAALMAACARMG
jgi:Ser/Thr protein kinase RdoA (MazF antagonist)